MTSVNDVVYMPVAPAYGACNAGGFGYVVHGWTHYERSL